jgi:hypothetical protein
MGVYLCTGTCVESMRDTRVGVRFTCMPLQERAINRPIIMEEWALHLSFEARHLGNLCNRRRLSRCFRRAEVRGKDLDHHLLAAVLSLRP